MAHLIYYRNEREEFKEEFGKVLPNVKAGEIVIKKLLKHYKLGNPDVYWTSGRNHSSAGTWSITINVEQNNFGVICHELAHVYQCRKDKRESGEKWHCKRHRRIMKRMLNYCRKKNWFTDELNRRLAPKPIKPEPTKEEIKQKKVEKRQQMIQRYERKIRLYQKKLSRTKRSLKMLLRK